MGRNSKAANYDLEFIKMLAEKGYGSNQVSQITMIPAPNLLAHCRRCGIHFKPVSFSLTPNQIDIAKDLYLSGKSTYKIAEDFNVNHEAVAYALKKIGVEIRDTNDKIYYHDNFNHKAFSDMSDEKSLYFYGLLLADGCLSKNKSGNYNCITIALKEEDKYMLQYFLDYLGSDNSIRDASYFDKRTNKIYYSNSISFNDTGIVSRLISYGFSPRKSLKEVVPPSPIKDSRHFWRGMIDGDGCLYKNRKSLSLRLVGSKEISTAFNDFVESNVKIITKREVKHCNNLFHIEYTGDDARRVSKLLYEDASIFLLRKKVIAESSWCDIGVNLRNLKN
jgi:predicted DNA-binding protein YlxM (UPF0122 family)